MGYSYIVHFLDFLKQNHWPTSFEIVFLENCVNIPGT